MFKKLTRSVAWVESNIVEQCKLLNYKYPRDTLFVRAESFSNVVYLCGKLHQLPHTIKTLILTIDHGGLDVLGYLIRQNVGIHTFSISVRFDRYDHSISLPVKMKPIHSAILEEISKEVPEIGKSSVGYFFDALRLSKEVTDIVLTNVRVTKQSLWFLANALRFNQNIVGIHLRGCMDNSSIDDGDDGILVHYNGIVELFQVLCKNKKLKRLAIRNDYALQFNEVELDMLSLMVMRNTSIEFLTIRGDINRNPYTFTDNVYNSLSMNRMVTILDIAYTQITSMQLNILLSKKGYMRNRLTYLDISGGKEDCTETIVDFLLESKRIVILIAEGDTVDMKNLVQFEKVFMYNNTLEQLILDWKKSVNYEDFKKVYKTIELYNASLISVSRIPSCNDPFKPLLERNSKLRETLLNQLSKQLYIELQT